MTSSSPRNIHHQVIQEKESISNNTITSSSSSPTPPQTPNKPQEIIGNNPYPTTFVQADTSNFKQVVQLLTGSSSSTTATNNNSSIPPIKSTPQKKQGFKLYERRNSLKNGFMMINTSVSAEQHQPHHRCSPRELLSPSILDFPSLVLSPKKPPEKNLSCEKSSSPDLLLLGQEEKAIAEKKFYLPPRTENVETTPQLLTLFPLTSPRVSGSSSS